MTINLDPASRALLGLDSSALREVAGVGLLHPEVIAPWRSLCEAARAAGFELRAVSGYRSFERQLAIFNAKAEGHRPVLDDSGQPVAMAALSERQRLYAILRFSALPGGSRHHWGTDMDVVDASAMPADYRVALTTAECLPGGVFAGLHRWLDSYLARPDCPFYRPYDCDRGGVAPEPWHLSYAPVADRLAAQLTPDLLRAVLRDTDIALKAEVLAALDTIFARFVSGSVQGKPAHA